MTIATLSPFPTIMELAQILLGESGEQAAENNPRMTAAVRAVRAGVAALGLSVRSAEQPHLPIAGRDPNEVEWLVGRLSRSEAERLFAEFIGAPVAPPASPGVPTRACGSERQEAQQLVQELLAGVDRALEGLDEMALGPIFLTEWLRRDTWTRDEGLALLAGVIPGEKNRFDALHMLRLFDRRSPSPERTSHVAFARDLSGKLLDSDGTYAALGISAAISNGSALEPFDCPDVNDALRLLASTLMRFEEFWDSGVHPDRNSPEYVVSWALQRDIAVPWLGAVRRWAAGGEHFAVRFLARLESISSTASVAEPKAERRPASLDNPTKVLQAIVDLGFDPLALPAYVNGNRSAKARVRAKLAWGASKMNKAWQSLRDEGKIRDS